MLLNFVNLNCLYKRQAILFKSIFSLCGVAFCLSSAQLNARSPLIHVLGDSHSLEFTGIESCIIHHIGPITMHRVGRDGFDLIQLQENGVKEGDIAIFAFGEIDVRCHIGKQRDYFNRDLDEIIENLLANYLSVLSKNKNIFKNVRVFAYSVTPPTNQMFNPSFPYYGSLEDRVMISKKMNGKLLSMASNFGIEVLDVYDVYADENGALIREYSDETVHIGDPEPLKRKLSELGLL